MEMNFAFRNLVSECYWQGYGSWVRLQTRNYRSAAVHHGSLELSRLVRLLEHFGRMGSCERVEIEKLVVEAATIEVRKVLAQQPITTRDDIRFWREGILANEETPRDWLLNSSGGSTGSPVQFFTTRSALMTKRAKVLQARTMLGWKPADRTLMLWGADSDFGLQRTPQSRLASYLSNFDRVGGFRLTRADVAEALETISRSPLPISIYGYASLVLEFFRQVENLAPGGLPAESLRTVWTSAERLHPESRAQIERLAGVQVGEIYGSREFGALAVRRPGREEFEVFSDFVIVEILDDGGQPVPTGMEGRICVTDLTNLATPFIRYEIGDAGRSGRYGSFGLSSVSEVVGRISDVLTIDGFSYSPLVFHRLFRELSKVREFRVMYSTSRRLITLQYTGSMPPAAEAVLCERLSSLLPASVRTVIEQVAELPVGPTGKLKVLVVVP
jgi:phenylacetate-CoA ligase